ncbi:tetratricopeptide repeat protein 27 [Tachypleus tridentatus]|uniref:tetratricopeptide repeat protein 27 n=1 Tax=Tachypleus tridentatus TaxID=6853 RepID=UPI003FD0ED28
MEYNTTIKSELSVIFQKLCVIPRFSSSENETKMAKDVLPDVSMEHISANEERSNCGCNTITNSDTNIINNDVLENAQVTLCMNTSEPCELITVLINKLIYGDFEGILKDPEVGRILTFRSLSNMDQVLVSWSDAVKKSVEEYLAEGGEVRQREVLFIGIASLQYFVQNNFTGPICNTCVTELIPSHPCSTITVKDLKKWTLDALTIDGETVYHLLHYPEMLLLAKVLFCDVSFPSQSCYSHSWWKMRVLFIHQLTLSSRCSSLYTEIMLALNETSSLKYLYDDLNWKLQSHFLCEVAHVHMYYYECVKAMNFIEKAQKITGLDVQLTGALGRRTHFQQKPVAQLLLNIKHDFKSQSSDFATLEETWLPKDRKLDDDTLLNKVKYEDERNTVVQSLCPEQQMIILALCAQVQKSNAVHPLTEEEVMAFVECVLSQPQIWCIQMQALLLRTRIEQKNSRRMERAMMQMQSCVDAVKAINPSAKDRLGMFYCTQISPLWIMEKNLSKLFLSLGAVKSALEVSLRLELWEDVISCYHVLQRNDKAEAVIRNQLQLKETPLMWCFLGDVTNNPDHYHTAWELSKHRSARAQKSLGYFYFRKKEYKDCIAYFQKALEINSLQLDVWFSLGFAANQSEDFEVAAHAYRRMLNIDSDNFEAWNNLSIAYIKTKQKFRAWKTLHEALKHSFENWKIWENLLAVSVDIGAFEDAISAWHRLIDIKEKHTDDEILAILVDAVVDNISDVNGCPSSGLRENLLKLMGRITATSAMSAKGWRLYAKLLTSLPQETQTRENLERAVQYLQKAHRNVTQMVNWAKDFNQSKEVLGEAAQLADTYLMCLNYVSDEKQTKQFLSSAKLMLNNVITRVKQNLVNYTPEQVEQLQALNDILILKLNYVTAKITI